ncbi:MAG TPA: DUF1343 domain-containing protein [Blastocatellia bacterium]|nr:DUF1343 domain-containing protein [Blastocatellia bacterium]
MKLGLEVLFQSQLHLVKGERAGLIVNPASLNSRFEHAVDLFRSNQAIELTTLFGPQHGIRGETQDNMIEWRSFKDSRTTLPVYSLYGETRRPGPEMLRDVDVLVFDVPDVGTRVYTFVYTMALAMEAAREAGKRFVVLDRPNPIGGIEMEGALLEPAFRSFVGMFPVPMRHGMTIGELALMFNREFGIGCALDVVMLEGWSRADYYDRTGLPWIMPSPNMPSLDTAIVYPGSVMFEGTNVSEGRGTTRPFEIIGAPWIEPYQLANELKSTPSAGVFFRPIFFEPTFHKFKGELCGGLQLHVTDRDAFRPVATAVTIIAAIRRLWPSSFEWKQPPYEYVFDKLPFDVINGGSMLREQIEHDVAVSEIEVSWAAGVLAFDETRKKYLLYE